MGDVSPLPQRVRFIPRPAVPTVEFSITRADGRVEVGRGPFTGIVDKFVSRQGGVVWLDDAGAFFSSTSAAPTYVRLSDVNLITLKKRVHGGTAAWLSIDTLPRPTVQYI